MTDRCRHTSLIVALVLTGACHDSSGGGSSGTSFITVHGTGMLVDELRPVAGFTRLTHMSEGAVFVELAVPGAVGERSVSETRALDGSLRVEEYVGPVEGAVVETLLVRAESNLQEYLISEVEGSVLKLRTASGVDLQPTLPIEFFVTVTSLEAVSLQGIGGIDVRGLTTDTFAATCTGIGLIELIDLEATELDVVLSGLGGARASGDVERQAVRLAGFGSYEAEELQSREADVLVEGIGSATVRVSQRLVARIESSGSVYYIGNPEVEATINGTGTVEQIGR